MRQLSAFLHSFTLQHTRFFSSVFAASKHFPNHPGIASGLTMALFGLSPFCLSVLASNSFIDRASGLLDVVLLLKFMAVLAALTHALGFVVLRTPSVPTPPTPLVSSSDCGDIDEDSRLLPRANSRPGSAHLKGCFAQFPNPIQDRYFWVLGLYCLLIIGAVSGERLSHFCFPNYFIG